MPAIELQEVRNPVLGGVDLVVEEGEIFVLLGPSGAGKTSLLNVLAGLMPYEGRVFFQGRLMNGSPPQKRRVGYLFQDLLLFPHLTVGGNLQLAMTGQEGDRQSRLRRQAELLELLGIPHLARRWPGSLSGGERQRVALARSLAAQPRLLLLDEPFNSLDYGIARHLRAEFKHLQRKLGLTTLLVTHNLEEAREMADRLAILRQGRLVALGDPQRLLAGLARPGSRAWEA